MTPGPRHGRVLQVLLIGLGGTLGTGARAGLEHLWPPSPGQVPWTTLVINVIGSFVLGLILERLVRGGPDEGRRRLVRLGVGTGAIGGFTTYSTFVVEAERLLTGGHAVLGVAYAIGSVALGVAAAVAGMALARRGTQRPTGGRA